MQVHFLFVFHIENTIIKSRKNYTVATLYNILKSGMWKLAINPKFLSFLKDTKLDGLTPMQAFYDLSLRYPQLYKVKKKFLTSLIKYKINTELLDYIGILQDHDILSYIATNLEQEVFNEFSVTYPQISQYFSGVYTVNAKDDFVKIPEKAYFQNLIHTLDKSGYTKYRKIFVSSSPEAVKKARNSNLISIEYKTLKQFKNLLNILGIFKESEINIS